MYIINHLHVIVMQRGIMLSQRQKVKKKNTLHMLTCVNQTVNLILVTVRNHSPALKALLL